MPSGLRQSVVLLLFLLAAFLSTAAEAPAARVVKVLPHYLDREGRHSLSPSLFDRDAYQAQLRRNAAERGGLRFDVKWKSKLADPLTLRLELKGANDGRQTTATVEAPVARTGWLGRWTKLSLTTAEFERFGELVAWRASLWQGSTLVSEQKSFLW
ncbi:MAG TPA: hypothetical protein VNO52_15960 [Methylomirabilota bacterium]|nr:hypothetical protein [Methylomirabilota bacterium]